MYKERIGVVFILVTILEKAKTKEGDSGGYRYSTVIDVPIDQGEDSDKEVDGGIPYKWLDLLFEEILIVFHVRVIGALPCLYLHKLLCWK